MEKISLRMEGIYDQRTFKFLKGQGFLDFSFDFRPLSLNFFPQHRYLELLQKEYEPAARFFHHYCDEKDFIIQKMLDDLKALVPGEVALPPNFFLEFSDSLDSEFYEQFQVPYYWHYRERGPFKEVLKGPHLKGIVLSFSLLRRLEETGGLFSFLRSFLHLFHQESLSREIDLEILLTADWDFHMIPHLFDQLDIQCVSLSINPSIEICYRNVDLEKLKKNVQFLQKRLVLPPA